MTLDNKNLYYKKLIRSFLVVFLFSMLFLMIPLFISYSTSRTRYFEQAEIQAETISSTLGAQIQIAFGHGAALFQNSDTVMYLKPEKINSDIFRSEIWRVQNDLLQSESSLFPLVLSEFVYFTADKNILESGGHYEKEFYFSQINLYEKYPLEYWNSIDFPYSRFILPVTNLTHAKTTQKVLPLVTTVKLGGEIAVHVCSLSMSYLEQIITLAFPTFDNYILASKDDSILASGGEISDKDDVVHSIISNQADSLYKSNGYFVIRINDTDNGLKLFCIQSTKSNFAHFFSTLILIMILIFIAIVLVYFIIILQAKHVYRPIKEINALITDKNSEHDEIANIQHNVKTGIANERDLTLSTLSNAMLLNINGISSRSKTVEKKRRAFFKYSHFTAVALLFELNEGTDENKFTVLADYMPRILQSQIESECVGLALSQNANLFFCILNTDLEYQDSVTKSFLQRLESFFHVDMDKYSICAGIGNSVNSYEDINLSAKEAMLSIPEKRNDKPFNVRYYKEAGTIEHVSFSFYDQKNLINAFQTENEESLCSVFKDILKKNEQRGIPKSLVIELYRQILLVGRQFLEDSGYTTEDCPEYQPLYDLFKENATSKNIEELKMKLKNVLLLIQRSCATKSICNSKIEDIRNYLELNYMKNISQDNIADAIGITTKYLSRLFKEETGMNLSDYVAKFRIGKAKELLLNHTLRINEVAEKVGIDNRTTFLRLFKKYEGIAPIQFRQIQNIENLKK